MMTVTLPMEITPTPPAGPGAARYGAVRRMDSGKTLADAPGPPR